MRVEKITKKQAATLIRKYHYLGNRGFRCKYAYGLFDNGLVGVIVFHSVSAPETVVGLFGLARDEQDGIYELGRLVLRPDHNGNNNATWFLSRAIKLFRQDCEVKAILMLMTIYILEKSIRLMALIIMDLAMKRRISTDYKMTEPIEFSTEERQKESLENGDLEVESIVILESIGKS